jgi:hypothetical protein
MADRPLAAPLAGIKVLEFSHTVMGPTAGLIFAELGADVVKIDPAPKGDHTRTLSGFGAGCFAAFNRNKRSLAVDLKRKEGQAAPAILRPSAPSHHLPQPAGRVRAAPYKSLQSREEPTIFAPGQNILLFGSIG